MTNSLKLGLILFFLFQVTVAAGFNLAHDEAYYWLFSRHLAWGYFDHPPFVAVVIAFFSFLPHHELSVRIGFILLQFGTLFFLFRMTPPAFWGRVFLLFLAFPLASYSGLLALPDMPLLFMTAVYFYSLRSFLRGEKSSLLVLPVVIALLLYAKYHGVLLIFFTILALPKLLLRKDFWMVALLSLIFFLPHLWWQKQHEFATLRYHFLERPSSSFSVKRIFDYLGTQLALTGLFCGPVIWWQMLKRKALDPFERALTFCSWGILIFFLISTFSKKVEANWTISLVIPLTLLIVGSEVWNRKWARYVLYTSFAVVVLARVIFVIPSLPIKRLSEFHGWKEWSQEVKRKCGPLPLLANNYQLASKLSFYLNEEVSALNFHSRKNQFDLWKNYPSGPVCYVTDKSRFIGESMETPDKKNIRLVTTVPGEELLKLKSDESTRNTDNP